MFTPGTKLEYNWRSKEILATQIGDGGPQKFMVDFFNELGEQGELVVNMLEEGRPSSIAVSTPRGEGFVPYYIIKALTVKAVESDVA